MDQREMIITWGKVKDAIEACIHGRKEVLISSHILVLKKKLVVFVC